MQDGGLQPVPGRIRPHVDFEDRRQPVEDRATEMRVAHHVTADEARYGPAAARTKGTEVARLDLRGNPVVRERAPCFSSAAHMVRIAMREDDDISGGECDALTVFHLDECG